jgi:CBS domain containing-hemolysin-like protein
MPVYKGNMNNVVGIVNTKDLFFLFSLRGVVILDDAIYPAILLLPDEDVASALQQLRKAHRQMALVRDAKGDILGLLTLEDILEEIVGEIEDEHDQRPPQFLARAGGRGPKPGGASGQGQSAKRP